MKLELHIKDMICSRCETVIRQEMEKLKARVLDIQPGYATVEVPTEVNLKLIAEQLQHHGFELLKDPERQLIEQVKTTIREYLYQQERAAQGGIKLPIISRFLTEKSSRSYSHISKLFSRYEGQPLEQYYIHLRTERVKELLDYNELNVNEIAHELGYSSSHYLSAQFKKVTGMSISNYRRSAEKPERRYFDHL